MRGWYFLHDDIVMEIALLIEDEKEYKGNCICDYSFEWGSKNNGLGKAYELIDKYKDEVIHYLYFGCEFCEYKLPTIVQLEHIVELCVIDELKLVLVTPVVTDYGVSCISDLLKYLVEQNIDADIVVNDVGVLQLLKSSMFKGKVILGRVFDKISHDSRSTDEGIDKYYGDNGKDFAMTPGVISKHALSIYEKYGVDRVEFDLPKMGINLPDQFNFSLYWPYSYLTTGRVCLLRSINYEGREKFLVGSGCGRACLEYKIEKRKPINGTDSGKGSEMFLFQRGNTIFYLEDKRKVPIEKINRLIIQP